MKVYRRLGRRSDGRRVQDRVAGRAQVAARPDSLQDEPHSGARALVARGLPQRRRADARAEARRYEGVVRDGIRAERGSAPPRQASLVT